MVMPVLESLPSQATVAALAVMPVLESFPCQVPVVVAVRTPVRQRQRVGLRAELGWIRSAVLQRG